MEPVSPQQVLSQQLGSGIRGGMYISGDGTTIMLPAYQPYEIAISRNSGSTWAAANTTVGQALNLYRRQHAKVNYTGGTIYFPYDQKVYKSTDDIQSISIFSTNEQIVTDALVSGQMPNSTNMCGSQYCRYLLTNTSTALCLTVDETVTEL